MADEKSKNLIAKSLDSPVKALLLPVASEVGDFFSDFLYHLTGNVHLSAEKKRAQHAHDLEMFKQELAQETKSKPVECLTDPKQQVVGQALDLAKNCLSEKEIRQMFARLIANAADCRYQSVVHPSFPAIISELSPLDAENLKLFYPSDKLPIINCCIRYKDDGNVNTFENCFIENPKMQSKEDLLLQSASIDALSRLGIIKVDYTSWFTNEAIYKKFLKSIPMVETQNIVESSLSTSKYDRADMEKGIVGLTPLGKTFVKVCFSV